MIRLTLYNDADIVVNADMIESVERTPDTLISLTTGKKVMVKESVEDVVSKVVAYRRADLANVNRLFGNRASNLLKTDERLGYMDLATILGLVLAWGALFASLVLEGGKLVGVGEHSGVCAGRVRHDRRDRHRHLHEDLAVHPPHHAQRASRATPWTRPA